MVAKNRVETDQPPTQTSKGLHFYFAKTVNFIDTNLRIFQYSVYCVGAFGLLYSLHSLRAFSKFHGIADIPQEFLKNHARLQGVIVDVSSKLPSSNGQAKKLQEHLHTSSSTLHGIEESKQQQHIFPQTKTAQTNLNPFLEEQNCQPTKLYLKVQHTPIFNFRWNKSVEQGSIALQIAGIQVKTNHLTEVTENLMGQKIWFRILRHNEIENNLVCIVKPKKAFSDSYNMSLLKRGFAKIDNFDSSLEHVKIYAKLYKKLLKKQEKMDKKPNWFRNLAQKILFSRSK